MGNAIFFIHDFKEANGKTIKENNLEKKHNIPIGTLVEVKFDTWKGDGACYKVHAHLWVVSHDRDCDGTPLYGLHHRRDYVPIEFRDLFAFENSQDIIVKTFDMAEYHHGFTEESLTPITVTQDILDGHSSLSWGEGE